MQIKISSHSLEWLSSKGHMIIGTSDNSEKLEPLYTAGGNVKGASIVGNSLAVSQKNEVKLPCDSKSPPLNYIQNKWKHMSTQNLYKNVHSNRIQNSSKVEESQMSNW